MKLVCSRPRQLSIVLTLALCAFALATIPGSAARPVLFEREAPPLPKDVGREAAIEVVVHAQDTAAAIPAARVSGIAMVEGRAYLADSATTDPRGHAHLAGFPVGEAWVLVDAVGWARGSSQCVLTRGTRNLQFDLAPEHHLDLMVRDDRGQPLKGAELEIQGGEPLPLGARTDDEGKVIVRRLGNAPWIVTARAAGYETVAQHGVRDGEPLSLVLRKLGAITVTVLGPDERPAPANVEIAGSAVWPARNAAADAKGHVRIGALPQGSYAIRATLGDLVSPIELGVTLDRGEDKSVTLRLGSGRFISVRVVDSDATDALPVSGAKVSLAEAGLSPFPLEGMTDKDGRTRLGPIAPGSASLSARAEGFVPHTSLVTPEPGGAVVVVLVRAGVLSGRVVDARGYPIDGASIEIVGTDPMGAPIDDDPRRTQFRDAQFDAALSGPRPLVPSGELGVVPGPVPPIPHGFDLGSPAAGSPSLQEPWVTRSDGTFRASPASPGRVRAMVRHPQYVEAMSDAVTLSPGKEAHVDVVLHAGGTLEGRVLDAAGLPASGARVAIAAFHGSLERTTMTGTDGTFAFASLPDTVSVTAFAEGGSSDLSAHVVASIPEGGRQTLTLQLPAARPPLVVHVKDDRGYPLDAVQISVGSLDPALPLRATSFTDARGEARVANARGLPLRLEARAPGHASKVIKVDVGAEALDIVLDLAESMSGEVWSARGGEPIVDADVAVTTEAGLVHAHTDAHGVFAVSNLAVGNTRVHVRASGYAPFEEGLAITSTSSHAAILPRIELEEEGIVTGTVLDSRGDPVPGARVAKDRVPTYLAVGPVPAGIAVTDAHGRFHLGELAAGALSLEAYTPELGRARVDGVQVSSGKSTDGVTLRLRKGGDEPTQEPGSSGGVAVTLGETTGDPLEVVLVAVTDASEAERAGLAAGDILLEIDGSTVRTVAEARAKLSGPLRDDVVVKFRRGEIIDSLRVAREPVRK